MLGLQLAFVPQRKIFARFVRRFFLIISSLTSVATYARVGFNLYKMTVRFLFSSLAAALLASAPAAKATLLSSGVNLGAAGETKEWSVLGIGDFTDINIEGNSYVEWDIGIAGQKRTARLGGNSVLDGDVYLRLNGKFVKAPSATHNGSVFQNAASNQLVMQAAADAYKASADAFAKPTSPLFSSITTINTNSSFTLNNLGTDAVLRLQDFILKPGAVLTLEGTANSSFVFNVTRQFSISSAQIVLQGGLLAENVLFNVVGKGARFKGTSKIDIHSSTVNGIFLGPERDITVTNSTVIGSLIGGEKSILITNSNILKPPGISPAP
jgi:hypothetical protein